MASLETKLHNKISDGLADSRLSPTIMALKMVDEPLVVQQATMEYMLTYVQTMAERTLVPMHMKGFHDLCKAVWAGFKDQGITSKTIEKTSNNEYIQVSPTA